MYKLHNLFYSFYVFCDCLQESIEKGATMQTVAPFEFYHYVIDLINN